MDIFRFVKQPQRANDATRRYRIVCGPNREDVGEVEIGGDAPEGDTALLTVACLPVLSDAAREDALGTARRFLTELATGWGIQLTEVADGAAWVEQPGGESRIRLEYRVVCAGV